MIVQFRLGLANVFLLKGDRPILVDTGRPSDAQAVVRALKEASVAVADLALILHTHGHWDHAGSTRQLKEWTRAPAAVHLADAAMMRRGDNGMLRGTSLTGRVLRPLLDRTYPGVEPDMTFEGELDLAPYGVPARAIPTPGHTAGSVSVLTADGDAIVGDLLMGGYLGGKLLRRRPVLHYYAEDLPTLHASIRALLQQGPRRIYVGHGGPLDPAMVARAFGGES